MSSASACRMYCGQAVSASDISEGGGLYPTRLIAPTHHFGIVALGRKMVGLHIAPFTDHGGGSGTVGSVETVTYSHPVRSQTLPLQYQTPGAIRSLALSGREDGQALEAGSSMLVAAVDERGFGTVHRLTCPPPSEDAPTERLEEEGAGSATKRARPTAKGGGGDGGSSPAPGLELLNTTNGGRGAGRVAAPKSEWGWAGCALTSRGQGNNEGAAQGAKLVTCHQLSRSLSVFDTATGSSVASWRCAQPPRALCWVDHENVVAVAEGGAVVIYDTRMRQSAASTGHTPSSSSSSPSLLMRQQPSHRGILNCVATVESSFSNGKESSSTTTSGGGGLLPTLCAAGDDRMVFVWDCRQLKLARRWKCPCKFDVTSLHAASGPAAAEASKAAEGACATSGGNSEQSEDATNEELLMYMSGLDNELLTCMVAQKKQETQRQRGGGEGKRRLKLGVSSTGSGGEDHKGGAGGDGGDLESKGMRGSKATVTAEVRPVEEKKEDGNDAVGGHGRLHQAHSLGVRGDARWVGVAAVHSWPSSSSGHVRETLLGFCSSGTLCVVQNPHLARPAV